MKFDLFRRYGAIAAAGDRHLAEFMPGDTYLRDPETVKSWKFGLTSVAWRKEDLKHRLQKSVDLVAGKREVELKSSGEEGVLRIKALCGIIRFVSNVNIPNIAGQIENMPRDCIVETNAVFERNTVAPIHTGSVPEQVLEILKPHIENQRDILKAALDHDFDLALTAFMRDLQISGRITEEQGRMLLHDMMENTKAYLPGWEKF